MLTEAQKKIITDSWVDNTQPNMKAYFQISAMEGMQPHAVAEEIVQLGHALLFSDMNIHGVTGQQLAEALLAGEFDQEIAVLMGYC